MAGRRAIFLDRDGAINVDSKDYIKSWEEFRFLPLVLEALQELARLDIEIIVVTNQSIIGRRIASAEVVYEINSRMVRAIKDHGGRVTAVYVCPHAPWAGCSCRKPQPGLLLQAAKDHQIDCSQSVMVGNQLSDVEVARAVGCRPILISPHPIRSQNGSRQPDLVVVRNLRQAARHIKAMLKRSDIDREVRI